MHKVLLVSGLSLMLFGCSIGSSGTHGDKINLPGNLTTDITDIKQSGDNLIKIYNNGQTTVKIIGGSTANKGTEDTINTDKSDCFGKSLLEQHSCFISLHTINGEVGTTELDINTNNGIYPLLINIDTTGGGVLDIDTNLIDTTKDKVITVTNKGSNAITLLNFKLEDNNNTLGIFDSKDNHCKNTKLSAGASCQLIAKASANVYTKHTLSINTSNTSLPIQDFGIAETTDKNVVNLYKTESIISTNIINIDKPGTTSFMLRNDGTNDIHVGFLDFNAPNIGSVTTNNCSGAKLQAGDSCNIGVKINEDAHESGLFTITTAEKLENPFDYKILIKSDNLVLESANSAVIHTNANKEISIVNKSNFITRVSSIDYDASLIKIDNSGCIGNIVANSQCTMHVKSMESASDADIKFNEFNNSLVKTVKLHINDGVEAVYQPQGNDYYTALPKDGNLYQVFSVVNNSSVSQDFSLILQHSDIATVIRNGEIPSSAFIEPNCLKDDNKTTIGAKSHCEIIVKEINSLPTVAPLEQSLIQFEVDYKNTNDVFIHKYQAQVNQHHEHRDSVYHPGDLINPTSPIDMNYCGINNGLATVAYNIYYNGFGIGSRGILFSVTLDNNVKMLFFNSGSGECISADTKENNLDLTTMNTPIVSPQQIYNAVDGVFQWSLQPRSMCDENQCNLIIKYHQQSGGWDYQTTLQFARPTAARDWDVLDSVQWEDLGVLTKKNK